MRSSELIKELLDYAFNGDMEVFIDNGKGVCTSQFHAVLIFPKGSDNPDGICLEPDFSYLPEKVEKEIEDKNKESPREN